MALQSAPIFERADQVQRYLDDVRERHQKIVLTQGTFDMVHIGHARYCAAARTLGDVLIVGVDSDQKVKQRKGPERPVVPQRERLEMLSHLNSVSAVVLKEADDPKWSLISRVKPDVLVATRETYTPSQLKELEAWCGSIVVLEPMATTSTSAKLRRLQIGAARKISEKLSKKLAATIESVLSELTHDDQEQKTPHD